jgi:transposase
LLCDGQGHPLHFHLTAGEAHESTAVEPLLEGADAAIIDQNGQPVAWPVAMAGDKGYRADWIDEYLLNLGIRPVIPSKENEDRNARAVEFDEQAYRRRSIIEQLIGWLKECRRVFSRFEKTAKNFGGMLKMAFIQRYLRLMCS